MLIVPLFWCLFAFFAFVPFDRKTPAQRILAITGGVLTGLLFLLYRRRLIGLDGALWMALDVTFMAALYSIPLRDDIPAEAFGLNEKISETHEDRYEYARALFHLLARCFVSPTREYLLQPHKIFVIKSAAYYWKRRGYVPSHLQAQLYRKLLLASRRFDETEVRYETGRCYNSPHGYVVIDHPERPIYADLWAAQNVDGYQFGQLVEMPSCEGLSLKGPEGEPYLRKPREDPRLSSRSRSR
ncbi:MAG TPA: hypothetical protein VGK04_02360 [Thermoanaerobaculia bacterium]